MKPKNAAMAGFLNIVFPGLGCAYLGRWFYALAYLIWVPLVWVVVFIIAQWLTEGISNGTIRLVAYYLILFGFRLRIIWDVFFTPYKLAEEHNQKLVSKMEAQLSI